MTTAGSPPGGATELDDFDATGESRVRDERLRDRNSVHVINGGERTCYYNNRIIHFGRPFKSW